VDSGDAGYEHTAADFAPADHGAPRQKVLASNLLQIRSRVSTKAKNFDSQRGDKWSVSVFGVGGGETRVYGVVKELGSISAGSQSDYRVDWDISVPGYDPKRANNQRIIGRRWFTKAQLRREDPAAGRRRNDRLLGADISSQIDRPKFRTNQVLSIGIPAIHRVDPEPQPEMNRVDPDPGPYIYTAP
jgi:hypothetical protein